MNISSKITKKGMTVLTYPIRNCNFLYKRDDVLLEGAHTHLLGADSFISLFVWWLHVCPL